MPTDPATDDSRPPEADSQPPGHFCLVAGIFEGALVVVAVGLGWLMDCDPMATLPHTAALVGQGFAWGLLAVVPMLAVSWTCLKIPLRPFVELRRVVDELLVPLFRGCWPVELAIVSLLAGLGEEMLFRGVIQASIADALRGPWGVWLGLGASAVLFGIAHRITWTYALLAGTIGLYLGGVWLLSGNLLVPIAAHAVYDFLVLVYLIRRGEPLAASPGERARE